jgi:hypothetical protein
MRADDSITQPAAQQAARAYRHRPVSIRTAFSIAAPPPCVLLFQRSSNSLPVNDLQHSIDAR